MALFQPGLGLCVRLAGENDGLAGLHAEEFGNLIGAELSRSCAAVFGEACGSWLRRVRDLCTS
jgi:hypothetical protein